MTIVLALQNACRQEQKNTVIKADDFDISINSPDTVLKDSMLFASIHVDNNKYKLMFAHFACNVSDTSTTDTTYFGEPKIRGCNDNLKIRNDSVTIYFFPGELGKHTFEQVTLLCKGPDDKYYYQNCTFDFNVK